MSRYKWHEVEPLFLKKCGTVVSHFLQNKKTLIPSFSMMINSKYVGSLASLLEEKEISKTELEADIIVLPL